MRQLLEVFSRLLRPSVRPDESWHWTETPSGPVMRRVVGGKTEDRPMTEDEQREYLESRAGW